jgi:hypothetical protein
VRSARTFQSCSLLTFLFCRTVIESHGLKRPRFFPQPSASSLPQQRNKGRAYTTVRSFQSQAVALSACGVISNALPLSCDPPSPDSSCCLEFNRGNFTPTPHELQQVGTVTTVSPLGLGRGTPPPPAPHHTAASQLRGCEFRTATLGRS